MPSNVFLLAEHRPDSHLLMCPAPGDGAQSQRAEGFLRHGKFLPQWLGDLARSHNEDPSRRVGPAWPMASLFRRGQR